MLMDVLVTNGVTSDSKKLICHAHSVTQEEEKCLATHNADLSTAPRNMHIGTLLNFPGILKKTVCSVRVPPQSAS